MVEIHPKLRNWVTENIRIGHDLLLLKRKLVEQGQNPAIVDQIVAELSSAERSDKFPDYIVQWLKYSESQGDHLDYIKDKLRGHGYSDADINFLIQKHVVPKRQEHISQFHAKEKKYNAAQWMVLAAILVVAAIIVIFLLRGSRAVPETEVTSTLPEATTTTLAGEIIVNVMQPVIATFYEKQAEGIKLATQSILGYNSTLQPGKYSGMIRAKADNAPVINAYFSRNLSNSIRTPLLKQYKSDKTQGFFYIATKTDLDYGWPHLLIATDNQLLGILEIDSSSWKDFSFDFTLEKPVGRIWVYFFDDWITRGINSTITADRSIYLGAINFYSG